jgi:hypothetical protein
MAILARLGSRRTEKLTHWSSGDYPRGASTEVLRINSRGEMVGDYSLTSTTPCCAPAPTAFC